MKKTFTRGKFARMNGVTPFTLRLYDRIGILKPCAIGENGYHIYTDDQSQQLLFIDLCIKSGFSLQEIKTLQHEIRTPEALLSQLQNIRQRIHQKRVEYDSCEAMINNLIYYHQASAEQDMDKVFLRDGICYQGLISLADNYLLPENAEKSHTFIRETEKRLGHPIEFPPSFLWTPGVSDLSSLRLIIRTQETLSGEAFYCSGPPARHCIMAFKSDISGLPGCIQAFLNEVEETFLPLGDVLLTPVQDYLFRRDDEMTAFVVGIPVTEK